MTEQKVNTTSFDFTGILQILFKWRKHIALITVSAAVIAFIFTRPFFMPDYFESTGVIYPSNIAPFSMESPTETMLQIVQSEDIKDQLIKDFDLYKHFGVNPKSLTHRKEIYEYLNGNISISRTAYESINITVADQSPDTAAMMVDSIIAHLNVKVRTLHGIKYAEVVNYWKLEVDMKKREIDSLETLAQTYATEYGIVDFRGQIKEVTRAYYRKKNDEELRKLYSNFRDKGIAALDVHEQLMRKYNYYAEAQNKLEQAIKDYNKEFTHSHIVTKPSVAETKSFPHRTIITLVFTISVFFFSLLVIFWIENYRKNIAPRLAANS